MRATCVLACALALTGCSVFAPKLVSPKLTIINVELLQSTIWQQRLRVHLRVENPNERALAVTALTYSIEVAGQELAHGAANESFLVPALGETEFATDVTANAAGTLLSLLARGHDAASAPVDYRIVGKVELASGFMHTIPFEQKGSFKLQ
jgi:LEA14-like dessication related protein